MRAIVLELGAQLVGFGARFLRLGETDLRLGLLDHRFLQLQLPVDALQRRVLGVDLGFGGVDSELVVAGIDARQQVAGAHFLVLGDGDFDDVARRPWRP